MRALMASERNSRPITKMVNLMRSPGRSASEYHSVTIVPPNVSTSSNGTNDVISRAARHNRALTGRAPPWLLLTRSLTLVPPVLPVRIDTGPSSSLTGCGFIPEHPAKNNAVATANRVTLGNLFFMKNMVRFQFDWRRAQNANKRVICKEKREGQAPPFPHKGNIQLECYSNTSSYTVALVVQRRCAGIFVVEAT